MPQYSFRCKKCDNRFDLFLPMSRRNEPCSKTCDQKVWDDKDPSRTALCNVEQVRVYERRVFQFVGDGFDATDLTQDQIDMTPEYWEGDGNKPKVKVIK